jgi:hypothetical protein
MPCSLLPTWRVALLCSRQMVEIQFSYSGVPSNSLSTEDVQTGLTRVKKAGRKYLYVPPPLGKCNWSAAWGGEGHLPTQSHKCTCSLLCVCVRVVRHKCCVTCVFLASVCSGRI